MPPRRARPEPLEARIVIEARGEFSKDTGFARWPGHDPRSPSLRPDAVPRVVTIIEKAGRRGNLNEYSG
jgi:hypothetical protein